MTSPVLLLGGVALSLACSDATPGPDITIAAAYAYAPPTTSEAAAYATFRNVGPGADTLLSITSPAAARVTLHRQVPNGAMVRMEQVPALPIPAGDFVLLEPGALHLMLADLPSLPQVGDTLSFEFTFRLSGRIAVRAPVIAYGATPPEAERRP